MTTTPEPIRIAVDQRELVPCSHCERPVLILAHGYAEFLVRHNGEKHLSRFSPTALRQLADELESMQQGYRYATMTRKT